MNEDSLKDNNQEFNDYQIKILHQWSKTLSVLGFTLVPLFILLDYFTLPQHLLPLFALYRGVATVICLAQYLLLRGTKPGFLSYLHGYFFSMIVGGVIVLMTGDLGGFDSSYYAGLNLVIIASTLLLPLPGFNSAINSVMIISMYIGWNLFKGDSFELSSVFNNLFFMVSTAVISTSINHVRFKAIRREFNSRVKLQEAQDALWTEMELAKKIQTSLIPDNNSIGDYEIAGIMLPAEDVGGDYFDIIETKSGENWVAIGDVSGHGLESGLIMMMAQISFFSVVNMKPGSSPSDVIKEMNFIIRDSLKRLGSKRYMTLMALRLDNSGFTVAGSHQDLIIYRSKTGTVESQRVDGSWIGLADNMRNSLSDSRVQMDAGDMVLLFTDGVTDAGVMDGEMFGQERLEKLFLLYSNLSTNDIIRRLSSDVIHFSDEQHDDITMVLFRKLR